MYGRPFTISGDAYSGLPQKVCSIASLLNTLAKPKSPIYRKKAGINQML